MQMIQCDNSARPPHYFPPQQDGSFKIVDCSEYLIEPIQWEEKDFCSLVCLAAEAVRLVEGREGRGRNGN